MTTFSQTRPVRLPRVLASWISAREAHHAGADVRSLTEVLIAHAQGPLVVSAPRWLGLALPARFGADASERDEVGLAGPGRRDPRRSDPREARDARRSCSGRLASRPRGARASSRQSPGRSWSRFVDQAGAFQTHRSPCSARQPWSRAYGPAEGGATGGVAAVDFVGPVPDPAAGVGVDLQQQFRNRSGAAIRRPWRRSRAVAFGLPARYAKIKA